MVYITSDMFGPHTTHDRELSPLSTYWSAMGDQQHTAGLGKRKRHGEDGQPTNASRQHRLSPTMRSHLHNTPLFESNSSLPYAFLPTIPHNCTSERRPVKQVKRLSPKASLVKSASHLMDIDLDLPPKSDTQPPAVSDLRPCHACKLAPKRKKDLENYLDCRRCEGRTCYICARQCVGGCGKAICKKCIVEVGQEGEAWCLDCYSRNINA
ncbi:hypothetical protein EJ02DRAFT_454987 [Clathrospora elynae]|uniref:Uncharacterized protein n=1 Tax=Clathrospora elynae TaxID=706981 RepID=A0A6A5SLU5_9PLEO|nr:hypothetical protein EJ02DRAFT_454987 [Clathrospora elynae]